MDGRPMYNFFIANNAEQLRDAFRLRYDVFIREHGMFPNYRTSKELFYDEFDAFCHNNFVLNAYYNDKIVASIRMTKESLGKSPIDQYYEFDLYRGLWEKQIPNRVFGSASMIVIREDHRHKIRLFENLMYLTAQKCVDAGVTNVLILPKYSTLRIYKKLGFHQIDQPFFSREANDKLIPMGITSEDFYRSVTRNEHFHLE